MKLSQEYCWRTARIKRIAETTTATDMKERAQRATVCSPLSYIRHWMITTKMSRTAWTAKKTSLSSTGMLERGFSFRYKF